MRRLKIDNIDLTIVKALYENSRISLSELSSLTGISITAVRSRLMKILKYGIIKRFSADVDFTKFGYNIHAMTKIKVHPKYMNNVISQLLNNWRVLRLYEITGDYDLLAEIVAKNVADLREFLTLEMYGIPGIVKTYTFIILKSYVTANPFKAIKLSL